MHVHTQPITIIRKAVFVAFWLILIVISIDSRVPKETSLWVHLWRVIQIRLVEEGNIIPPGQAAECTAPEKEKASSAPASTTLFTNCGHNEQHLLLPILPATVGWISRCCQPE